MMMLLLILYDGLGRGSIEPPAAREALLPPPAAVVFGAPVARAYPTPSAPRLDGKLEPGEWGPDTRPPLLVERLEKAESVSPTSSALRLLRDADNLYLALVSPGSKPSEVEVLLQGVPEGGVREPFVLRTDATGKLRRVTEAGRATPRAQRLQQAVKCAGAGADGQYTTEWRIPLAAGDLAFPALTEFRLNLRLRPEADQPWLGWAAAADLTPKPGEAGRLVFAPTVALDARNLAANGDLEGGNGQPGGWGPVERIPGQRDGPSQRGVAQWVAEGRGGSRCLKLEALDPTAMRVSEFWWAQSFRSPGAGTYLMSYEVRARDLVPRGDGGQFYGAGYAMWTKDGQAKGMNLGWTDEALLKQGSVPCWTRKEAVFEVPADAETIYLLFGLNKTCGTVWVDNVRLERCE